MPRLFPQFFVIVTRWGLGIIYVLAELRLLGSNDQEDKWHFLQSRIKEWDQMRHCSLMLRIIVIGYRRWFPRGPPRYLRG
jgi:COQ9